MKSESITNITDRGSLAALYNSRFAGRDVFLRTDGINIKVRFIKYDSGRVYLDIPVTDYEFTRTSIYTRSKDEIVYSHIIPHSVDNDYYIFEIEGSQVFTAPRKEERLQVSTTPGKKTVISQIISSFVIKESMLRNRSRIDWIRHEILSKVSPQNKNAHVYFLGDRYRDVRMSWIMDDREPIFIPDINSGPETSEHITDTASYIRDIYYHDTTLQERNLVSEITIPLLYRMMMPFGYIQVNDTGALNEENYFMLRRLGMAYSESLSKDSQLFRPSDDTISISDLSMTGAGIIFREKSLLKHFREDALIIFTAHMPSNAQSTLLCRIVSISCCDGVYRVGCAIESIDSEGSAHYKNFLTSS